MGAIDQTITHNPTSPRVHVLQMSSLKFLRLDIRSAHATVKLGTISPFEEASEHTPTCICTPTPTHLNTSRIHSGEQMVQHSRNPFDHRLSCGDGIVILHSRSIHPTFIVRRAHNTIIGRNNLTTTSNNNDNIPVNRNQSFCLIVISRNPTDPNHVTRKLRILNIITNIQIQTSHW